MDPQELARIQQAIRDFVGRIPAEDLGDAQPRIDSYLRSQFGVSYDEYAREVANQAQDVTAPSQGVPGMTMGDYSRLAIQGIPLVGEYADEVMGDTERINKLRSEHPVFSLLGESASAAVPATGAWNLLKLLKNPFARLGVGAAMGGITGAVEGAGMAEGDVGERLTSAPTVIGGATGAFLGSVMGGVAGRQAVKAAEQGRPARVAGALEEGTGVRGRTMGRAFDSEMRDQRSQLGRVYNDLAGEFPEVTDPQITSFLEQVRSERPNTVRAAGIGQGAPTFDQLKDLRTRLQGIDRDAADVLTGLMDDAFGGSATFTNSLVADSYRDLTRRYAQNSSLSEAMDAGRKHYDRPARDIGRALEGLSDAEKEAFRAGQATRVMEVMTRREEGTVALLRRYMDAGEPQREIIRTLFPPGSRGDTAFEGFMDFLRLEDDITKVNNAYQTMLKWAGRGAVATGMLGGGYSVIDHLVRR